MQQVTIKEKPFDAPTVGDEDFQNPFLFLWQKKKRFLHAKEKEALMALLRRSRKRHGGAMLYAANQHPSRPRPSVGETGKSFGPIFPPPGLWTKRGVGA